MQRDRGVDVGEDGRVVGGGAGRHARMRRESRVREREEGRKLRVEPSEGRDGRMDHRRVETVNLSFTDIIMVMAAAGSKYAFVYSRSFEFGC